MNGNLANNNGDTNDEVHPVLNSEAISAGTVTFGAASKPSAYTEHCRRDCLIRPANPIMGRPGSRKTTDSKHSSDYGERPRQ